MFSPVSIVTRIRWNPAEIRRNLSRGGFSSELLERLLEFGALDVSLEPIVMKKGRPGNLLRVVCKPEQREALVQMIFAETSTLGMRIHVAERRVQAQEKRESAGKRP